MRGRNKFYQAVVGSKKNIGEQYGNMCFGMALQKNNLIGKDKQALLIF